MRGWLRVFFRFAVVLRFLRGLTAALPVLVALSAGAPARADDAAAGTAASSAAALIVGLAPAPPFAMQDSDGNWQGISVELWRHVAQQLGIAFEFRELSLPELYDGLRQKTLLAVVTAIASPDREAIADLSHPYYASGFAIAVPVTSGSGDWLEPLGELVSGGTVRIFGLMVGLLGLTSVLVWLIERKANPEQFNPRPLAGIADGLWWAAVTLTSVGYGDKTPRTRGGRALAVAWMFTAVILIALFTAQVTSSLTVTRLASRIRGPADLTHVRVGVIQDSPQQSILLAKFGIAARGYPGIAAGLAALARGEIDAFVSVEPALRYEIATSYAGTLAIAGTPFLHADFVFAFPLGSPVRKPANEAILAYIDTDEWQALVRRYLGSVP